jgi:hypothetical protein
MTRTVVPAPEEEDLYSDDFTHPIRQLGVIDTVVELKGGGAYYGITIATPLGGDVRSQERLLRKIEAYLGDFRSERSRRRNGEPTPAKCKITVGIHPDSDPVIFELLERCRPWVEENGVDFRISTTAIGVVTHQ